MTPIHAKRLPAREQQVWCSRGVNPCLPLPQRFWVRVRMGDGCWEWTGRVDVGGYGVIMVNRAVKKAHRWAYETEVGPIPPGMQIDHLCLNHACVRPDHLEVVTLQENTRRGIGPSAENRRKTHCPRGHLLRLTKSGDHRRCRPCAYEQTKRAVDKFRRQRLAEGLCIDCEKPPRSAMPGRYRCQVCAEKQRLNRVAAQSDRLEAGYCTRCGIAPARPGRRYCQQCADQDSARKAKRRGR